MLLFTNLFGEYNQLIKKKKPNKNMYLIINNIKIFIFSFIKVQKLFFENLCSCFKNV